MSQSVVFKNYYAINYQLSLIDYPSNNEIDYLNKRGYNKLAMEYDSYEHITTRMLEKLSIDGFLKFINKLNFCKDTNILEIGCGTGKLTDIILNNFLNASLDCIDISHKMLLINKNKIFNKYYDINVKYINKSIFHYNYDSNNKYNFIICGLGDPYLTPNAFQIISDLLVNNGYLFISIPEYNWGMFERKNRINTALNMTRFKLKNEEIIECYSFLYDHNTLNYLMNKNKFKILYLDNFINEDNVNEMNNKTSVTCVMAQKKVG
jgi:SAM-dependent methyltransferase